ncbi:13004_t:CDS:2, partial [Gigaspora rosea]
ETFDILEDFIEGHRSNTSTDQLQQITEAQVNKIIRNSRGRLLPGSIPYSAAQTMINEIQIMVKSMSEAMGNTFSRFPGLVGRME